MLDSNNARLDDIDYSLKRSSKHYHRLFTIVNSQSKIDYNLSHYYSAAIILTIQPPTLGYAKITRRMAAFFYDIFLYAAAFIVVGAIAMIFIVNDLPGANIQTLGWFTRDNPIYLFVTWIILPIAFFGWFWTRGGQTLSMRSWRIRIETLDGNNISWLQSALRLSPLLGSLLISFLLKINAPLIVFSVGLVCMLWSLISKKGQGLNDIIAGTRVIRVERGYVPPKKITPNRL